MFLNVESDAIALMLNLALSKRLASLSLKQPKSVHGIKSLYKSGALQSSLKSSFKRVCVHPHRVWHYVIEALVPHPKLFVKFFNSFVSETMFGEKRFVCHHSYDITITISTLPSPSLSPFLQQRHLLEHWFASDNFGVSFDWRWDWNPQYPECTIDPMPHSNPFKP